MVVVSLKEKRIELNSTQPTFQIFYPLETKVKLRNPTHAANLSVKTGLGRIPNVGAPMLDSFPRSLDTWALTHKGWWLLPRIHHWGMDQNDTQKRKIL
jgi:hypothetical protein